jgi:PTH1 family peptidyl-tRNA hydrolase
MLLLVGLGNPGPEYERNRHNIGFMAVDAIAGEYGFPAFRSRFQGLVTDKQFSDDKLILLKPMTYMNNSGQSVGEAARYFKLEPSEILIVQDEMDLAFGKAKIKSGGGSAGHNGIRSIDAHLGTTEYRRLRLGVGHPGNKERVHNHVLSDFSKSDRTDVEDWILKIAKGLPDLVAGNDSAFLNALANDGQQENQKGSQPKKAKSKTAKSSQASHEVELANEPGKSGDATSRTGIAAAFENALSKLRGHR